MAVLPPLEKRILQPRESDADAEMSSSSASEEDALDYNMSEDLEDSPAVISPPPPSKPEKTNKYKNSYSKPRAIQAIKEGVLISDKSPLISLDPFLDEYGELRMGGRLQNASLPFQAKHPVILPASHEISSLLIREFHFPNLHDGPTLLPIILCQMYWIIAGKRLDRKILHRCVVCIRIRQNKSHQLMGKPKHISKLPKHIE
ncbi:hypothetical protein AVEN_147982-1 [Araneus ventricosus]|uniref:Integrase zinc-binding domain-containing protein n=1 Tax=Araneus ventricosus TaxID=182803 RepID=A0A4Y2H7M4_ARAVE|nr:hypothetical protein AVEN_147982-1 [Araneus ventricosus]